MDSQENLLDCTNNLIHIKLNKDMAFSLMKNIENICRNFDSFRSSALLNMILTESHLYLFIKLEKLENLFSMQIEFNNQIEIQNTNLLDQDNLNNQYLIKLNTFRNLLKSLNFKHKKSMNVYLCFNNNSSKLITRVTYFDENEFIYIEKTLCSFIQKEENEFNIKINEICGAEFSAVSFRNYFRFARENFLKDNGNDGSNFNFLLVPTTNYEHKLILKIRFYKTSEKKELIIDIPFYAQKPQANRNYLNNSNYSQNEEDEFEIKINIFLEQFESFNIKKIIYDTKHILNFFNCFSYSNGKFGLNILDSLGLQLDITIEPGFKICYVFPCKGIQI